MSVIKKVIEKFCVAILVLIIIIPDARSAPACSEYDSSSYAVEDCVYSFSYFECESGGTCILNSWACETSMGAALQCWQ
jgi:hypothetical protein